MPIWLWDVSRARIAWANRACLTFSGALSMDQLIRLKFQSDAPFARQLGLVSKRSADDAGIRELLRFPAKDGEFIFDCLCSSMEIDPGQAGVLVELVADKGKVTSTPEQRSVQALQERSDKKRETRTWFEWLSLRGSQAPKRRRNILRPQQICGSRLRHWMSNKPCQRDQWI